MMNVVCDSGCVVLYEIAVWLVGQVIFVVYMK